MNMWIDFEVVYFIFNGILFDKVVSSLCSDVIDGGGM